MSKIQSLNLNSIDNSQTQSLVRKVVENTKEVLSSNLDVSDSVKLETEASKGKVKVTVSFDLPDTSIPLPDWFEKSYANFEGYKTNPKSQDEFIDELNSIIKDLGIDLVLSRENLNDKKFLYDNEGLKQLQNVLNGNIESWNGKLSETDTNIQHKKLVVDGDWGENSLNALGALRDSMKNVQSIDLNATVMDQVRKKSCFYTSEAMYFNQIHNRDDYTEFNVDNRGVLNNYTKIASYDADNYSNFKALGEKSDGTVIFSRDNAMKIVQEIDNELDKGKPIIVGVSHSDYAYNGDGITDHFVLIYGRSQDEDGNTFYLFNDSAGREGSEVRESEDHRLYLDPMSGLLHGKGDMSKDYTVASFVRYEENTPGITDSMKNIIAFPGDQSEKVKNVQIMLTSLDYSTQWDGNFDSRTKMSIKEFQLNNNLKDSGILDKNTYDLILNSFNKEVSDDHVLFKKDFKYSKIIQDLQTLLSKNDFSTNGTDGVFGGDTETAVKKFQEHFNIAHEGDKNYGKIDKITWLKLLELNNETD